MPERDHAVVVGSGMGGLLAARVLSESFGEVTVVERDAVPLDAKPRRGVPQGRHVHGFQARGVEIIGELFPGVLDEARAEGVSVIDDLSRCHFAPGGHLLAQESWPIAPILLASRPFLEHAVRRRVAAHPRIRVLENTEVTGLIRDAPGDRSPASVLGVRISAARDGSSERPLPAELVVDASGRGCRVPRWLPQLGYRRPEEERLTVRVRYASEQVQLPPASYPRELVIEGRTPTRPLGMALFACEHDTWTFTVMGTDQAPPPTTHEGMVEAVSELAPEWVVEALRGARPRGRVSSHHFPASVRHRYDRLTAFPRGLLVFGDAMCSYNPIYGTGMSVAAEQALALRRTLADGPDHDLALRFFREAARPVGQAWQLAVGSDMAMPEVEGDRPLAMRLSSRYVDRVLSAAEQDPEVARRFLRVAGLVDPPSALLGPRVVARVVRAALLPSRQRGSAASSVVQRRVSAA